MINRGAVSPSFVPVRVLLVDDSEPWRRSVCSMLRTHQELQLVGEVADGLEAVQKSSELRPDLILLDIGLPGLNGIEAANRIRQVAPAAKILVLTQESDADVASLALSRGAQGYVVKADAGTELLPGVEAILRGDKFVGRGVKGPRPN